MNYELRPRLLLLALALGILLAAAFFGVPFDALGPSAEAQGAADGRFVPSEQLPADSSISFPVDI